MDSHNEIHRRHGDHVWKDYDGFQTALLVGLSLLLLPAWRVFLAESMGLGDLLAGASLPAALGFLLVLRCGTVDLSVWAVMGAGGLVAAWVINAFSTVVPAPGWALLLAVGAAVLLGTLIGALNAVILRFIRLPGFVATALVGLGVLGLSHLTFSPPSLSIPDDALDPWVSGLTSVLTGWMGDKENILDGPLLILRMLVVFVAWTCVLTVLLAHGSAARKNPQLHARRWAKSALLIASGALAGLSGVCWLIDQGQAPLPTRLVDGLTIPVAAVLAGAVLLRGKGRTQLAVICLPPALLLANVWEMMVWPITIRGYSVSLAVLGCLALLAQRAFVAGHTRTHRSRTLAFTAMILSGAGMALLGLSPWFRLAAHRVMVPCALTAGLAGLALLVCTVLRARRHPEEINPANDNNEFTNDK